MQGRRYLMAILTLVGCKSDEQKLLDANRDKMTAALSRLKALKPLAEAAALTTATWPVPGAKVGENTGVVWSSRLGGTCNRMYVTYTDNGSDYIHLDFDRSDSWFEKPTCAVEGNVDLMMGLGQQDVDTLVNMKYALVLHARVKQVPRIDPGEASASVDAYMKTGKGQKIEHFVPGHIAGEALLYELATTKLVGGFRFDATSSPTVKTTSGWDELVFDLNHQLEKQIQAELRK